MPLWLAVRISTSYPIFYNIVEYNNFKYIDGAASSNCAVEIIEKLYNNNLDDTLCITLNNFDIDDNYNNNDNDNNDNQLINKNEENNNYNLFDYVMDLTGSLRYMDIFRLKKYSYNLLMINSNITIYKEKINKDEINNLIKEGYYQTIAFFENK